MTDNIFPQAGGGSGGSSFMAHGVQYEDEARVKYEAIAGERVLEYGLMVHPDPALSWLGASPDGVTETTGRLLEIKWQELRTSGLPPSLTTVG